MPKRGMRVVLLTAPGCEPCEGAKDALRKYIQSGEIEVLDIKESDEAADLYIQGNFNSVPQLLIVSKEGKIFAQLGILE